VTGGSANGTNNRVEMWYVLAPAAGYQTLTVNLSASTKVTAGAITFTGINQTTPLDGFFWASGGSSAPTVSVTDSAATNVVLDVMAMQGTNTVSSVGAGQTQQWTNGTSGGGAGTNVRGAGSTEQGASGSVTMSYTMSATGQWVIGAVSINPSSTSDIRLESFDARYADGGVSLSWRTGLELDNLGFRIHREVLGQRALLTPSLIAGSALFAGVGTTLTAGKSYGWFDADPPYGFARYWLEEVSLAGKSTFHGPVSPVRADGAVASAAAARRSALLAGIGKVGPAAARRLPRMAAWPAPGTRGAISFESPTPAVKLRVREEGWYRVSLPALAAAGLSANPETLRLYADGQEQACLVTANGLEFYGLGLDSPWASERTYFVVGGQVGETPKRMSAVDARAEGRSLAHAFSYTVERRDRSVYFAALKNGDGENFFGPSVSSTPAEIVLPVRELASPEGSSTQGLVEVALQGVTSLPHDVKVTINGTMLGRLEFFGQTHAVLRVELPARLLAEGENRIVIASERAEDVSLLDWARVTYMRRYQAEGDVLRFALLRGQAANVGGFSRPGIRAFDVTDPSSPVELTGQVTPDSGGYRLTLSTTEGPREVFAFVDEKVRIPSAVNGAVLEGETLSVSANLVIVSHADFMDAMKPLVAKRRGQDLSVELVDVESVYDRFGYGHKSPAALRRFLEQAKKTGDTKYVLLVGDASLDPNNYLGMDKGDFVPTKLVETRLFETASDDWLVDFDGNGTAELAVGRLPVRTQAEAAAVAEKLINYQGPPPGESNPLLVLSGRNNEFDFAGGSRDLVGGLPGHVAAEHVAFDSLDGKDSVHKILASSADKAAIVTYFGHGSTEVWADGLLGPKDIGLLMSAKPSVFVPLTCLNGFFHDVYTNSLSESLMTTRSGGALAVWASSDLTYPHEQLPLGQAFVRSLLVDSLTLGEAAVKAKANASQDHRRTWILFGDPSMRFGTSSGGSAGGATTGTAGRMPQSGGTGCGCRVGDSHAPGGTALLVLVANLLCVGRQIYRRKRR
jgi:MYXO-CTERM domain-containing protein